MSPSRRGSDRSTAVSAVASLLEEGFQEPLAASAPDDKNYL